MSADSSSRMPMWNWATRRKPLNHWSRGSYSGRLECHGSGWIPDLTRCEAIQGFRVWSAVSVSLECEDRSSLNFDFLDSPVRENTHSFSTDRRSDSLCHRHVAPGSDGQPGSYQLAWSD